MSKSKRFRVSQQDAASPIEASVTETVIDDDGNEVEVTRDLSGGNGSGNSSAGASDITGDADANAPQQGEGAATLENTTNLTGASAPDGKLADGAITAAKILDEADGSLKLAAGAITAAKLPTTDVGAQDGSIAPTNAAPEAGASASAAGPSDLIKAYNAYDAGLAEKITGAIDQAQPRFNPSNTPESDLTGGAGNAASPAQDADEMERRRFVILSRVRLNNRMHPVGAPVRITKSEHQQLAKAGAVDPDWDDHED